MKVRPAWWLAGCELGWTVFTFAQAAAQSTSQVYAFRFFVAFFEAAFQPVSYFLIGSWYTKKELGKRMAVWYCFMPAGQAFSGYLQAAIFKGLDGAHGIAGWRWLYIVCGCMTVPAVVLVFIFVPDFPSTTKIWYLNDEEKELACKRCLTNGTNPLEGALKPAVFKEMWRHWRIYMLPLGYIFYGLCVQAYNYFGIFLKSENFSVEMRNIIPASSWIASIPVQLFIGYLSDRLGTRFWVMTGVLACQLVPSVILTVWPASTGLKIFGFFGNPLFFITSLYYTWLSEICSHSAEERGMVLGVTNTAFYAFNAFLPNLIFVASDSPSFRKGFPTLTACLVAAFVCIVIIRLLYSRQQRRETQERCTDEERNV